MTPERYQQIDRLVDAALELAVEGLPAFLDRACAGDEELRQEVERLLAAHRREESFLTSPALEAAAKEMALTQDYSLPIGRKLGHYQVLSLLGVGGMGEVYLAEDARLDRKVAIKLLPPEFARDPDRVRRFVREAKAASALNHPNIITIADPRKDGRQPVVYGRPRAVLAGSWRDRVGRKRAR
jgi:serine/threonine protein kinase